MLAMERNEATATAVAAAYSLAGIFKRPLLVVHARDGAKQAAEKGLFPKEKCEKHASGPEGHIHFMPLIPGINPRPTARRSFSAAFKATVNPCADALEEFGLETSEEQPVRCMVKAGTPAEAMAEAIAEFHPCILVAGVKRTSETPGPHGTAFALLACSRVPVLCVPPEGATRRREREIADPVEAV
jgi:nucleotide-binding universal stress UspA family protein